MSKYGPYNNDPAANKYTLLPRYTHHYPGQKCMVEGCDRDAKNRGCCGAHYVRIKLAQDGNPLARTWIEDPITEVIPYTKPNARYRKLGVSPDLSQKALSEIAEECGKLAAMPLLDQALLHLKEANRLLSEVNHARS